MSKILFIVYIDMLMTAFFYDFPKISDHLPKMSDEDVPKARRTFPNIFPKIS